MAKVAADGSINVTVVDGEDYVGALAANGSLNVLESDGSAWTGRQHESGATVVVVDPALDYKMNNKCGAMNVTVSPYTTGKQKVTVVAGAFA